MKNDRKYKILINILSLLGIFALVGSSAKLLLMYLIGGDEDVNNGNHH